MVRILDTLYITEEKAKNKKPYKIHFPMNETD